MGSDQSSDKVGLGQRVECCHAFIENRENARL